MVIKFMATIADVTKYTRKGFSDVIGREFQIDLRIKYKAEFLGIDGILPDPYSDLKLRLGVGHRRTFGGEAELTITLTHWSARTHVPSPTSGVISAETINARLRDDIMKNIIGKARVVGTIPSPLVVLSVKAMANGDLKTYIEPL